MKPESYLTDYGKRIFNTIASYLEKKGLDQDVTSLELSMLANSFDLYDQAANTVKTDGWQQYNERSGAMVVTPAYMIMKTEFNNIKNHASYAL